METTKKTAATLMVQRFSEPVKEHHIVAYFFDPAENKQYELDLYHFGVRFTWPIGAIWTVAKREMRNIFNKPVDSFGWK